jgi:hypothetical protein
MGIVRMGPPKELIYSLRKAYNIENFIETGTYYGNTAYWASQIFEHVVTIEYSESIYKEVTEKYRHVENIEFLYGDTRHRLEELLPRLKTPSIFWLDAHWSGGSTYGETDQCPIIEEIEIINRLEHDNFILIDDARLFMSPPPAPNSIEQWPDIIKVLSMLHSKGDRYIAIIEDVIIAAPTSLKSIVIQYCQYTNQKLWEKRGKLYKLGKGWKIIFKTIEKYLVSSR